MNFKFSALTTFRRLTSATQSRTSKTAKKPSPSPSTTSPAASAASAWATTTTTARNLKFWKLAFPPRPVWEMATLRRGFAPFPSGTTRRREHRTRRTSSFRNVCRRWAGPFPTPGPCRHRRRQRTASRTKTWARPIRKGGEIDRAAEIPGVIRGETKLWSVKHSKYNGYNGDKETWGPFRLQTLQICCDL